ncbi:MAG TPA: cell division protein FtsZ [Euryarchaeota archaeon]|nr:cell division protein FtsZ [Euryarchaeota archaeon]
MSFLKLVEEALEASDPASMGRINPKIVVFGCGGGGCNCLHRMKHIGLEGVETVAVNTDKYHLSGINSDHKIFLGEHITRGYGTGGDPRLGEKSARDSADQIKQVLADADLVFITAGMGGGSGTGIAPVVSELASKEGSLSVGIVTTPFSFERGRLDVAKEGIASLSHSANCTVILDNDKLLEIAPKLPVERAFTVMDHLIAETVKGFSETICTPSMINLDFSDFRSIMSSGGLGTMMFGESEDVQELVSEALCNPFMKVDFNEAKGALIHITGGSDLSLKKAYQIFEGITDAMPTARNVKFGARIKSERSRMINVMGIVTGLGNDSNNGVIKPVSYRC